MNFNVHMLPETVKIKVLSRGIAPKRATEGAAGYDCHVCCNEGFDSEVVGRNPVLVGLGFCIAIPEGYVGLLIPRSSLFKKLGLKLANCVGVIDSDYRGEVMAQLHVASDTQLSTSGIPHGARICQLVIVPIATPELELVDKLPVTDRGEGGFGSTDATNSKE